MDERGVGDGSEMGSRYSAETYVGTPHQSRLGEMALMIVRNMCFGVGYGGLSLGCPFCPFLSGALLECYPVAS